MQLWMNNFKMLAFYCSADKNFRIHNNSSQNSRNIEISLNFMKAFFFRVLFSGISVGPFQKVQALLH